MVWYVHHKELSVTSDTNGWPVMVSAESSLLHLPTCEILASCYIMQLRESSITRRPSLVVHHSSPIIRRLSPVVRHRSSVTHRTSLYARRPSNIFEASDEVIALRCKKLQFLAWRSLLLLFIQWEKLRL